jgi:hypothetical protein
VGVLRYDRGVAVTRSTRAPKPQPKLKKTFKTIAQDQRRTEAEEQRQKKLDDLSRKDREAEDEVYRMIYGD